LHLHYIEPAKSKSNKTNHIYKNKLTICRDSVYLILDEKKQYVNCWHTEASGLRQRVQRLYGSLIVFGFQIFYLESAKTFDWRLLDFYLIQKEAIQKFNELPNSFSLKIVNNMSTS